MSHYRTYGKGDRGPIQVGVPLVPSGIRNFIIGKKKSFRPYGSNLVLGAAKIVVIRVFPILKQTKNVFLLRL